MDTYNKGLEAINDKPRDCLLNGFPVGLRVLVIDDDRTCLTILERMLKRCLYQVTTCQRATEALSLLRQDKNRFDIVVSDVHMPDMDGFELLKFIGIELDLPIVMMSSDDKQEILLKGIVHGACDYLIKPIRMDSIKVIWQHVLRKRRSSMKAITTLPNPEEGNLVLKEPYSTPVYAVSKSRENVNCLKRRKDDEDTIRGKKRMVWTPELHQKFLSAVNHLGCEKAVPMKILDLMQKMNVAGITRENIASHLQKHRLHLRQNSNIAENSHQRFEFPRLNKKSVSDELHSSELCHNNQFSSSSNHFVQPSFTHSLLSAPITFSANSSIGMPLNDRTNLLPTGVTNFNNCLAINSLANDFPPAVTGASGANTFCRNVYSLSIPSYDASKYRSQETAAAPSESLSAGDSHETEYDVRPLLEYDPSLHFQNFNQSGVLQEPFSAEDDASLAIDYESAWQLN